MSVALRCEVAVLCRPCAGHVAGGDLACWRQVGDVVFVLTLDATGHGVQARRVAELAEHAFGETTSFEPAGFLTALDVRLRGTLGAAAAVARIDLAAARLGYAGVGNVSARLWGQVDSELVNRDGMLGQRFRSPRVQQLDLRPRDVLVMHSDGVSQRYTRESLPELHTGAAQTVAARLIERYGKQHDDAGCAVVRLKT